MTLGGREKEPYLRAQNDPCCLLSSQDMGWVTMFLDLRNRISSQAMSTVQMTARHRICEEIVSMAFQTDATAEELCLLPTCCLRPPRTPPLISKVWFDGRGSKSWIWASPLPGFQSSYRSTITAFTWLKLSSISCPFCENYSVSYQSNLVAKHNRETTQLRRYSRGH